MTVWADAARKWGAVMCLPVFFVLATACKRPEVEKAGFLNESPGNEACLKHHLPHFQQPKTGPLRVVVYTYEGQPDPAFEKATLTSPVINVFNGVGGRLIELKIIITCLKITLQKLAYCGSECIDSTFTECHNFRQKLFHY